MDIDLKKKNKLDLKPFIKVIKVLSILGFVIAIAGIAIYPLASNKPVDKVKEKTEKSTSVLPPANYTIIMGKKENKVVIKFHKQASELHLKNISTEQYNCLLNGRGLNCVLATAYQSKSDTTISGTKHKN